MAKGPHLARIDALLLLMTLIWGSNFSIVKAAFAELPPGVFNALRLSLASVIFLTLIGLARRLPGRVPSIFFTPAPLVRRDWITLLGLGVVGHFLYQLCFIGGLARTSVANSALILGVTPVVVALASAGLGHERVGRLHWAGAILSVVGIYLVVGQGPAAASLRGDGLMMLSVACWVTYTIGARTLMVRHSPLFVTGVSMAIGTVPYVALAAPELRWLAWSRVSAGAWLALTFSAVFALCVAYMIWYTAVRQIGNARTAVYSNLTPIVALAVAVAWLGEPVGGAKIAGATLVVGGVALTRVRPERRPPVKPPGAH